MGAAGLLSVDGLQPKNSASDLLCPKECLDQCENLFNPVDVHLGLLAGFPHSVLFFFFFLVCSV